MESQLNVQTDCRMVGEFIDDAVADSQEKAALEESRRAGPVAERVPFRLIGSFVDLGPSDARGNGGRKGMRAKMMGRCASRPL